MAEISFKEFERIMSQDIIDRQACIEIWFSVDGSSIYKECWLGKELDHQIESEKICYWVGVVEGGSQGYVFYSFEDLVDTKFLDGKSIREAWDSITLHSVGEWIKPFVAWPTKFDGLLWEHIW